MRKCFGSDEQDVHQTSLKTTSPEPQVQIKNHFTEMVLIMPLPKLQKQFHSAEQDDHQSSR